ncbi:two-component system sensor histidine kinase CreC [Desulfoluna spongiiphila]|uniref:two-component system sensor histidine kinase CreC n=1 Tax=Desulfoluna spongiiphila TaxID=419481 RepID=UPI001259D718|nr:two-component system sensor histidine kinase CreC [Desulfoluna spongiiphila]VVS94687.1 histidine kinase domain [Desulfoluna spongiiphila]
MKLAARILIAFFLILSLGFYYITHDTLTSIRGRYLEGVEESLVDGARIMAAIVSHDMETGTFAPDKLRGAFAHAYAREFASKIYHLNKTSVDMRVYITDNRGILLFDSLDKEPEGTDYSQWRDVSLTLEGKYGARSSREGVDPNAPTVLYVAAPILIEDQIKGVLTVGKPTTNINSFLLIAKSKIIKRSIIALTVALVAGLFLILFITRPIKRLTRYAEDIRNGKKAALPSLDQSEIGEMGRAFESMKEALEGRQYVETYVQTLTHEIKSPISAIQGAAELLEEEMPAPQRLRFIRNIQNESRRIRELVDRMLELAAIENMKGLKQVEPVAFHCLTDSVTERLLPLVTQKRIHLVQEINRDLTVTGDIFLLKQAISNLIQNALDFSSPGETIRIATDSTGSLAFFSVEDRGPGIPDYAQSRLFEKFFSLQRPGNAKKSTGLGLNFVKEIAELHRGDITIENRTGGGARATLTVPVA